MSNIIGYRVYLHNKDCLTYTLHKEEIEENEKICFEDMPEAEWFDYHPHFHTESLEGIDENDIYEYDNIYDD